MSESHVIDADNPNENSKSRKTEDVELSQISQHDPSKDTDKLIQEHTPPRKSSGSSVSTDVSAQSASKSSQHHSEVKIAEDKNEDDEESKQQDKLEKAPLDHEDSFEVKPSVLRDLSQTTYAGQIAEVAEVQTVKGKTGEKKIVKIGSMREMALVEVIDEDWEDDVLEEECEGLTDFRKEKRKEILRGQSGLTWTISRKADRFYSDLEKKKEGQGCSQYCSQKNRYHIKTALTSPVWVLVSIFMITFALFGRDLNVLIDPKTDDGFVAITVLCIIVFTAEMVGLMFIQFGYFPSSYFWLDLFSLLTLFLDIPAIADTLFSSSFAFGKSGRAARAGARAGRFVTVLGLVRVSRIFRLRAHIYQRRSQDKNSRGAERQAKGIARDISSMITEKVILMVMALFIVLPIFSAKVVDPLYGLDDEDLPIIQGLYHLGDVLLYTSVDDPIFLDTVDSFTMSNVSPIAYLIVSGNVVSEFEDFNESDLKERDILEYWIPEEAVTVSESTSSVIFNASNYNKSVALMSIITTIFVISALSIGAYIWHKDSKQLAASVTTPLIHISKNMEEVARGNFDRKYQEEPTSIFEIAQINESFWSMRNAIDSFEAFTPNAVVKKMIQYGGKASLGVVSVDITLLHLDAPNLVDLCEHMTPEDSIKFTNEFFQRLQKVVEETNGTLVDFSEDRIQVFWNAPEKVEEHEEIAVRSALRMLKTLRVLETTWKEKSPIAGIFEEDRNDLAIRIGIHTALTKVGYIGAETRLKYGAVGMSLALVNKIKALNSKYGTEILISEQTEQEVRGINDFRITEVAFAPLIRREHTRIFSIYDADGPRIHPPKEASSGLLNTIDIGVGFLNKPVGSRSRTESALTKERDKPEVGMEEDGFYDV